MTEKRISADVGASADGTRMEATEMNPQSNYTTSCRDRKDLIYMICGIISIGVLIGVAIASVIFCSTAYGETEDRWVICQPDSFLNIREEPTKNANVCGWLFLGDQVQTDGKTNGGFIHIINASTESGDGWVAARYLMETPTKVRTVTGYIEARSRVAVRSQPGGKRTRWAKPGETVTVYCYGSEWTVTNKGFIRSEFVAIGE